MKLQSSGPNKATWELKIVSRVITTKHLLQKKEHQVHKCKIIWFLTGKVHI